MIKKKVLKAQYIAQKSKTPLVVQSAIEAYEIRITNEIMADKSRKKIFENINELKRTNVKKIEI